MSVNDLICLSHLRWDFVFQRPQHLMSRWARHTRVYYVEEPIMGPAGPRLDLSRRADGLRILVPHLPAGMPPDASETALANLLDRLLDQEGLCDYVLWYYTPMALPFTRHLAPSAVVYDCMDELSAFRGAPTRLVWLERQLLERADVVTTGGHSLHRSKLRLRSDAHLFPSSVDTEHFSRARAAPADPDDQREIPRPRLGFFGVIDERLDTELVAQVAQQRPAWQLILLGPVTKIDPKTLPRAPNIHYLGPKAYADLPLYLSGWDVALLPFARNESTRFISPTKTPEYLAAGRPVVSTSIADVVEPYGRLDLVRIADTPADFVRAVEQAMRDRSEQRLLAIDSFLSHMSWDATWSAMATLVENAVHERPRQKARSNVEGPPGPSRRPRFGTGVL